MRGFKRRDSDSVGKLPCAFPVVRLITATTVTLSSLLITILSAAEWGEKKDKVASLRVNCGTREIELICAIELWLSTF
jgi:hypothetical protein